MSKRHLFPKRYVSVVNSVFYVSFDTVTEAKQDAVEHDDECLVWDAEEERYVWANPWAHLNRSDYNL